MAERREVFDRIRRKELSKTDAAKLLGISRTRINQLMKSQDRKAAAPPPPAAALKIVNAGPAAAPRDPAPPPAAAPGQVDQAPAGPVDLKAVLDPVAPAAAPGAVPVHAVPMENPDADDAEAGRELLGWIRRGAADLLAKVVYKAKVDDPRLEKLKEENKFLKVALKRNSDKAAPLGWFTRGWVGLLVGFGIEFIRVATTFPAPQKNAGSASKDPIADAPSAPPTKTTAEVRAEAEAEGAAAGDVPTKPRLSIEDRLRIFNKGQ